MSVPTIDQIVSGFADDPTTGLSMVFVFVVYKLAKYVTKAIPDSATGFPGMVRKLFRVLTIERPNVQ
jgi:hypothetical protein